MKLLKQKIAVLLIVVMALSAPLTCYAAENVYAYDNENFSLLIADEDDESDWSGWDALIDAIINGSISSSSDASPSDASSSNASPSNATPDQIASLSDAYQAAREKNADDYTTESWEAFKEAMQALLNLLAKDTLNWDAIDQAVQALNAAMEGLTVASSSDADASSSDATQGEDTSPSTTPDDDSGNEGSGSGSGTVEDSIDTSALEGAIATAEGLTSSSYTTTTWSALEAALADAKAVLADENATQEEVDAATEALLAAINALKTKSTSHRSSSGGGGGSSSSSVSTSTSGSWQHDGIGWWYQYTNGGYPKSSWLSIGGQWYYFNDEGYACYGWQKVNGSWYYLDPTNCNMLSGWHEDPQDGYWYYLNPSDGRMLTNWQQISDVYYFFNPIEPEEPTWTYDSDNSEWNYTNDNHRPFGSMYADETTPDGYEVDENGAWIQ